MSSPWPTAEITSLCDAVNVGHVGPSSGERDPSGIPFLMGKNVFAGKLRLESLERVNREFHDTHKKSQLRAGDIVVVRIGRSGEAAVVPESLGEANCSGLVIIKNPTGIDRDFLVHYLNSPIGQKYSLSRAHGATRRTLNTKTIATTPVPVPPLAEQQRIVAILDEAFEAIERVRELNDTALDAAEQLLLSAIDCSLESARGTLTPLSELLSTQPRNGWSPPKQFQTGEGVPVMTLSSVTGFRYRSDKYTMSSAPTKPGAHYWLKGNDLLITRSNTRDLVGHVAVYDGTPSPAICPDLIMKMEADKNKALTRYLYYCLRSSRIREYFMMAATGTSGTMQKINKGVVQSTLIPWSPLSEQEKIVNLLDEFAEQSQRMIAQRLAKAQALAALQHRILNHAFSGQLERRDTPHAKGLAEAIA